MALSLSYFFDFFLKKPDTCDSGALALDFSPFFSFSKANACVCGVSALHAGASVALSLSPFFFQSLTCVCGVLCLALDLCLALALDAGASARRCSSSIAVRKAL